MAPLQIRFHQVGSAAQFAPTVVPWLNVFLGREVAESDAPIAEVVFAPTVDDALMACLDRLPPGTVVYPGSTAALTVDAVEHLRAHGVARILCDLLPDELPVEAGMFWAVLREKYFFLPTLGAARHQTPPVPGVLVVGECNGAGAAALVAGVPAALLIEALRGVVPVSEDGGCGLVMTEGRRPMPALVLSLSGLASEVACWAAHANAGGAAFVDWRRVLSPFREPGLRSLRLQGGSLREVLTTVLAAAQRRVPAGEPARPITTDEWVRVLVDDLAGGSAGAGDATGLTRINRLCREATQSMQLGSAARDTLVWQALRDGWYRDGETLNSDDHALVARRITETVAKGSFAEWSTVRAPERVAARLGEVGRTLPAVAAHAGLCLMDGVCGGLLAGWRREVAVVAGELYRRAGGRMPAWLRGRRAALLAALGDLSAADADWQALDDPRNQGFGVLQECLRLWMPEIECDLPGRPTQAQADWWWRRCADLEVSTGGLPAWTHLLWMGRIFGLEPGGGSRRARVEDWRQFNHGMLSGLALSAWLCGRDELLGSAWTELGGMPPPTNLQSLFYWAVAHALQGRNPAAGDWLRQVEQQAPHLLRPQWPPQQCCFLAAAAWRALGDAARAGDLLRRALAEEPLAPGRLAAGRRAVGDDFRMDRLLAGAATAAEVGP